MPTNNVLYNGRLFTVIFQYDNGFCEIRDTANKFKVALVHSSQLTTLTAPPN
ncbi:hypothetical protein [Niallia sp. 03133]|uniref:hypothetical protein n=1 Tax=Niallia sp. 03133 TaxID=3458060 RepID=UPI004044A6B2